MSSLPVSEVIAALNSIFVQSCLNGVIITLLLYDYILTLGREVELFWCRGPTVARVVFFSLRLSVLGAVITTVLDSYVPKYDETIGACTATYNSYIALWFLGAVVVAVITAVRAYAVTDCSYVWTIFTLALGLSNIILNAYYQAIMKFHLVELQASITCWESAELPPSFNTIVTLMMLICNTLADAVVIFATWVRTFHIVKLQRKKLRAGSIAWLLLRDGTIYFLYVFAHHHTIDIRLPIRVRQRSIFCESCLWSHRRDSWRPQLSRQPHLATTAHPANSPVD
ncbi:hypothetical protein DAEQUDRAFT_757898 [Daedalea quercina L-15889]|uniref:DUF6533 domain-containing protein n=1 Tax=Daedalea quercina L-15889 TaxID=1314783 RepID=A0A165PBK0_9APHY|nr:hypothetical protein DAEQUDRAFT_757898 [Daedalea quercina L-15889]